MLSTCIREWCAVEARPIPLPSPGVQVHEATIAAGAYPSPYNYYNYPKSVCTSINEIICHGIPDRRPLREGDIINVDVSVFYRGYHGGRGLCSAAQRCAASPQSLWSRAPRSFLHDAWPCLLHPSHTHSAACLCLLAHR